MRVSGEAFFCEFVTGPICKPIRQVFVLTRKYLGEVVKSVKKMEIYFKGFEGHVEYSIKGSMCRFERKFLQLKPEGAFASLLTAALPHSLQLGL